MEQAEAIRETASGDERQQAMPGMYLALLLLAVTWGYLFIVATGNLKLWHFLLMSAGLACLMCLLPRQERSGGISLPKQCAMYSTLVVGIVANLTYLFLFHEKQYAVRGLLPLPLLILAMLVGFKAGQKLEQNPERQAL